MKYSTQNWLFGLSFAAISTAVLVVEGNLAPQPASELPVAEVVVAGAVAAESMPQPITSTAETLYVLSGLENPQLVGSAILVDPASKPVVKPAGLVTVDSDAEIIRVKASDRERRLVPVEPLGDSKFLILGAGEVWVEITCIDFEAHLFDEIEMRIEIGEVPEPDEPDEPDKPEPDDPDGVPEDKFDNLGKRVAAACEDGNLQFDLRGRVAEVYEDVADDMDTFEIKRTADAVDRVRSGMESLSLGSEWQQVFNLIAQDGQQRQAIGWEDTIAWYRAAARGFKGQ